MPVQVVPRDVVEAVEGRQGVNFATAVPKAPPTAERPQATDIDAIIDRPSIARANLAPSTEKPEGSREYVDSLNLEDYTVLQQHVMFWDRDRDGQIWPHDTFIGFYELGFNLFFCLLATLIINLNFSYPTRLAFSYLPDPFFRVYVPSIHKAKHGSDSGTYDKEGRFVPQAFEDLFSKFDRGNKGALSARELWSIMSANRLAVDPFGWFASIFEFGVTFLLVQKDGMVDKEDLRGIYDGSMFWRIRDAYRSEKGWNKGFGFHEFFNLSREVGQEELAKNRSRFPLLDGIVSQVEKTFPHKLRKA
ncbi:Caleosin related protein-domain-containing protein [Sordaria brevicollis]|uniref:Caleosin related protein-domain-containing protein n=1 Tax=Sordaria brevicollis TaxID=83679 RepID=A0AAE0NVF6_SORBR|nr:Caleosin related protein-domain-containing protein [Sordaria brevicollis]